MDKQRLTTLINQPEKLEEGDFRALTNLKKEYPYFQALSPLIAIGSRKFSNESEKKHVQSAAMYALDRKHLKEILSFDHNNAVTKEKEEKPQEEKQETVLRNKIVDQAVQTDKKAEVKQPAITPTKIEVTPAQPSTHLPDSFFAELFKEMEALKAEKENYQRTLDRFEQRSSEKQQSSTTTTKRKTTKAATSKSSATKKTTTKAKTTTAAKKSSSSKKATTAKSTTKKASTAKASASTKKTTATKKSPRTAPKKAKKEDHDIIEEITSRKELKISDAHKKEQLNIINNFIENEPVLTKRIDTDNQSSKQKAEDLSASSTNLSDDVVSETLAKLMIKQGRKQKAIDIYKKLIWKFPQKKTYFVEIIDELKKES